MLLVYVNVLFNYFVLCCFYETKYDTESQNKLLLPSDLQTKDVGNMVTI